MRQSKFLILLGILAGLLSGGCGSSIHDSAAPGPIDRGLYRDAVNENQQRIAGEDHRVVPLYETPMTAVDVAYEQAIGNPLAHLFSLMSGSTPGYWARRMFDPSSADIRREAILKYANYDFGRHGEVLKTYVYLSNDPDYTVRAAALRAMNRSRVTGQTDLYLEKLKENETLVRLDAADALSNVPDPAAIDALVDHMQNDVSQDVRIACTDALRNFRTMDVARALVERLDDNDFAVAWQARQDLELMTGQDFRYDGELWLGYLANQSGWN